MPVVLFTPRTPPALVQGDPTAVAQPQAPMHPGRQLGVLGTISPNGFMAVPVAGK